MPPKIKTTSEDIMKAALEMTREEGFEKLNARSLAQKLGISVQPLFRCYRNMEKLKREVVRNVLAYYENYLQKHISIEDGLVGLEMAYIRFAREEKHYFRLIQMSDRYGFHVMGDFISAGDINRDIVEAMAKMTGLPMEKAAKLYTSCLFTAHGLAVLLATNHIEIPEEQIREIMDDVFYGVAGRLREEEENEGRERD